MKYTKGYKYQVWEDFRIPTPFKMQEAIVTHNIILHKSGELHIRADYAWDGASGPTIDTQDTMVPSLVHDALYELLRGGYLPMSLRPNIDQFLGKLMKDRAVSWEPLKSIQKLRADLWARETTKFAAFAAETQKEIYEVE